MVFKEAPDVKRRVSSIISCLALNHLHQSQIFCYRSYGSSSRATARIWSLPQIWQKALKEKPHYIIEVLSEKFDRLDETEKIKVITKIEEKFEEEIIRLLFEGVEEIQDLIFDNIMPDDLQNPDYKRLSEIVLENYKNDIVSPSAIIEKIEDDNLRNAALSLTLNDIAISAKHGEEITSAEVVKKNALRYAADVIKKFRITKINEEIEINKVKIKDAESDENILELLKLNRELEEEKKAIREEKIFMSEIE